MSEYYILFANETGTDDSVISKLRNIDTVKSAHGAFGQYDVIAKIESDNQSKAEQDITNKIRKIPQVRSTLTLEVNGVGFRKTNEVENEILEMHSVVAYVMIHCSSSDESEVIEELKNIPEVIEASELTGSFEIICKVVAPSYNEISEVIANKIRKIKNIKSTTTLNIVGNQGFQK
ncbi:Lrp/AsnC ligand binding domain-containing protein [Nitrosopumilus sp. K4]|uniref:Lrp/AsnC ligand binding domain-containing protein n=1 Tax=Nitrosopumilus sp. K4 TaxID=2795383 RepID=UPI001BA8F706|nr:Lrp/AsnC ligand binding domain-containing protein [Nitrosopumilus sp. K4]QUC64139.1 Lrp/AsnC ligand binding domain-containing protein [Nitrosopumilus sp. K4]